MQAAPPKPVKDAKPAKEPAASPRRRARRPTREAKASDAIDARRTTSASGAPDRDTNYPGLVSAHLRRHKQYPSDARSRGDQGTATVTFSLDGGGRVTSAGWCAAPALLASIRRCRLWYGAHRRSRRRLTAGHELHRSGAFRLK